VPETTSSRCSVVCGWWEFVRRIRGALVNEWFSHGFYFLKQCA